jgi:hypothetical protein
LGGSWEAILGLVDTTPYEAKVKLKFQGDIPYGMFYMGYNR